MNNLAEITTTATNQAPIVPINLEAEQLLLGTLLFDNEQLTKIADTIIADDFYHPLHQELFNQINKFYQRSIIATPVTLKNLFESNEALKEHGGINYLSDLATQGASCFNIVDHAKTVRDLALRRQLMSLGRKVVTAANNFDEHDQAQDLIEQTELQLYNLASVSSLERDYYNLGQTLNMAIERANFAHQNQDHITGLSTGFNDINNYLTGWQNGDLVILAARPSMGKTSLALNFAVNACKFLKEHKQQYCAANNQDPKTAKDPSVGFFSLEMSAEQLSLRILSTESSVNSNRIRNGELSDSDFEKIVAANQELQAYNMLIDDTPALTIAALKTRARRMKRQHNLAILFVDYLQLLRGVGNNRDGNRVQEISEITQGLKAIAKELNIPVIALSQLSRAVEQREDKHPQLADLRESGSIEQDADIVMFIYRAEYYLMRKEPSGDGDKHSAWVAEMEKHKNVAEIIIAKHRNGPIGTPKLYFDSMTTNFANYVESLNNYPLS